MRSWRKKRKGRNSLDGRTSRCNLEFYQLIPFEVVHSIPLLKRNFDWQWQWKGCCCSSWWAVDCRWKRGKFMQLKTSPIRCGIHSETSAIIALPQTCELNMFYGNECLLSEENVCYFFLLLILLFFLSWSNWKFSLYLCWIMSDWIRSLKLRKSFLEFVRQFVADFDWIRCDHTV